MKQPQPPPQGSKSKDINGGKTCQGNKREKLVKETRERIDIQIFFKKFELYSIKSFLLLAL